MKEIEVTQEFSENPFTVMHGDYGDFVCNPFGRRSNTAPCTNFGIFVFIYGLDMDARAGTQGRYFQKIDDLVRLLNN